MVDETNALIVIEQPKETIPPPDYGDIKVNQLVALKKEGIENIPPLDEKRQPYLLFSSDGMFYDKNTILGRSLTRSKYLPSFLPKLNAGDGHFFWNGEKVPAEICSQAVSFFRRIFAKHKTEAEVILLMHWETKEWKIYVPYQEVSHSSVEPTTNPHEIEDDWLQVGTMHSHCDFSPFHSGTDIKDAEDMDGMHFTVGFVDRDVPGVDAMIMSNGVKFDFKPDEIGDFSDLSTPAPEEWDERVTPNSHLQSKHLPTGFKEAKEKYGKKPEHTWGPSKPTYQTQQPYTKPFNGGWTDWESEDWDDWYKTWGNNYNTPQYSRTYTRHLKINNPSWEDSIDDDIIDAILDSSVFGDDDYDKATENPKDYHMALFWRNMFHTKLVECANILEKLGMKVEFKTTLKNKDEEDEQKDLLPMDGVKTVSENSSLADAMRAEGFNIVEVLEDGTVIIDGEVEDAEFRLDEVV